MNPCTRNPLQRKSEPASSLQERAHQLIPGGCHTYAKGDDQFPESAPAFIVRGQGAHSWDIDGNQYIEYGAGCRAVALGHAYPEVIEAVQKELAHGTNFSRPAPIEVEAAEEFLSLIDGADMVKFAKDGSNCTTAALKLARAYTGRDHVALCGSHPFFATNDWFIGTTAIDAGIPESIKQLSHTFTYNDLPSLERLFEQYPDQIACVILEPAKYDEPEDNFLHKAQELCRLHGAVFVLDEMITGFRWHEKGAQHVYNITPDLSTFGKAIANGFSVSALAGKRELMELGGLNHPRERVFLLSTTHGAETHALAAAIATMRIYQREPVVETLHRQGMHLKNGLEQVIRDHQLQDYVKIHGRPCSMVWSSAGPDGKHSQDYRTLLMQETIRHGVIAPSLVISYSHTDLDVEQTVRAFDRALDVYEAALNDGVEKFLQGAPTQSVYRKWN
ncbi:glutamate-1-semialdehyde 2,1-aminomutase [Rubinisphaera margarita]|uniref:glutamate-1-semialdehyde 2,1-aminomutase n=1 Tax=Rubinisphaera margarita TaxID=2909586 RepID=UPI001EE7E2EE|nr:glutamate-1-semialdehyde 2,1-aminomutase [Rubinisphaera margarita]MCG6155279.1 glutamate-1-semialdehyde 2,1-aminomutase [Rubinisphaera margarita]